MSWALGIFCTSIELYIYIYNRSIMVIGPSGVQLTEWINAKGESDSSIKTMTKFEFET